MIISELIISEFSDTTTLICSPDSDLTNVYHESDGSVKSVTDLNLNYCLFKNNSYALELLDTLVEQGDPFTYLMEGYYNQPDLHQHIGITSKQSLSTSVCTATGREMYRPGEFLIDFKEWPLITQNWLQQVYLK